MSILDSIRYENDMEGIDELKVLATKYYPKFRRFVSLMEESGLMDE